MKVWSGLLLIFVVGVIIGVLTSLMVVRHHARGFIRGGPGRAHTHMISRLIDDLDLTGDQREQIEAIIDEGRPRLDEMSSEFFRSMKQQTEEQMARIREILDEQQKKEFDRKKKEMEERFRRFREGKGKRRPRPRHGDSLPPPPGG